MEILKQNMYPAVFCLLTCDKYNSCCQEIGCVKHEFGRGAHHFLYAKVKGVLKMFDRTQQFLCLQKTALCTYTRWYIFLYHHGIMYYGT